MGRNYFSLSPDERKKVRILEVGCGSCSNLWMIAKEGFVAYGIDLSEQSISLGKEMLKKWGTAATISVGNMCSLEFEDDFFDVIVDVFSSNCLPLDDFRTYLHEANRVTRLDGKLFLYTPSTGADAFKNYAPAQKIDDYTLNGIYRETSPYYGNFYPFRFEAPEHLQNTLLEYGFEVTSCEVIRRSYNNRAESFEHLSVEARKTSNK